MPLLHRSSGAVSVFDIHLNAEKNVIVLRGSPGSAASVLLTGKVLLNLSEPMSIKRISLKLSGKVQVQWTDSSYIAKTGSARHYRYEACIFEKEWPNMELGATLNSPSATTSAGNSSTNISGLAGSNSNSSTNISLSRAASFTQLGGVSPASSHTHTHTLSQGLHEFPFETILPGSIDESVEGLEGAFVVYKMVAVIERGRFANNMTCKKHVRVIRTLGNDILELSQSVSVNNTWPGKVDYTISTPNKALAFGSQVMIDVEMSPLLKGLKLGPIRVWLTEQIIIATPMGASHSYERNVMEHVIPAPPEGSLGEDLWNVRGSFNLPANLSNCTQDCVIHSFIKVGHKLKFAISLKNPDGHTSELRASLPVYVFISPNVPINAVSASENLVLFDSTTSGMGASTPEAQAVQSSELLDLSAPPVYENHIYDRLWEEITPAAFDSPIHSGTATPAIQRSRRNSLEQHGFTPINVSSLSGMSTGSNNGSNSGSVNNSSANLNHLANAQARLQLVDNLNELQRQQIAEEGLGGSGGNNSSVNIQGLSESLPAPGHSDASHLSSSIQHPSITNIRRSAASSGLSSPAAGFVSPPSLNDTSGNSPSGYFAINPAGPRPAASSFSSFGHATSSPDFSHFSPNMPSTPQNGIHGSAVGSGSMTGTHSPSVTGEMSPQLDVLSRVPSYETAIHSNTSPSTDEAPSYDEISTVINRAFQRASASNTPGASFPTSPPNLQMSSPSSSSMANFIGNSTGSSSGVHLSALRRAAASASQLSHIFGSHSGNNTSHNSSSAGSSSAAFTQFEIADSASSSPSVGPSSTINRNKQSIGNTSSSSSSVLRSLSRPGSGPNSTAGSRSNSRPGSASVSRSNSLVRSQNSTSGAQGFGGLTMTSQTANSTNSPVNSGSSTPHGGESSAGARSLQNNSPAEPSSVSTGSSHLQQQHPTQKSSGFGPGSSHSSSHFDSSFNLKGFSGHKSKPTSGTSTPTLSNSHRSHSSRSLIGEATKLLHLTKLSQKQQHP